MNPGGIVIVIVGVWLGCQVFGGNGLERLGIVTSSSTSTSGSSKPAVSTSPLQTALGNAAALPA